MNYRIKLICTLILSCLTFATMAQNPIVIEGRLTDFSNHEPIAGIMIMSKDSTAHAISESDGSFIIKPTKARGELWVFGLGYQTMIVPYHEGMNNLNLQLKPDSRSLNEVKVTAFGISQSIKNTAGSVALLNKADLSQGDGTTIQQAMNSVPGIRMDHSDGEDSKISIRGLGVRAPWGIRNIKIYLNDIPLTETDGTSRIEAVDVSDLGQVEIIKGPASSIYGGGTAGVIKFRLAKPDFNEQSFEASAMAGAYGLNRQTLTYRGSDEKFSSYVSIGRQYTNGYRDHSADKRHFIAGNFQWFPSLNRTITMVISRSVQEAQIPGALTADQIKENPKQANTDYTNHDAGRKERWTRIGVGQQYDFNNHFSNSSSVFTYFYDLDHPLPFGIINSDYQSFGGRTKFDYKPGFKVLPTTFTVGGEFTQARSYGNIYVNNSGVEGNIFSNTAYKNRGYSVFYQSFTSIGKILDVTVGLSLNGLTYNGKDFLHPTQSGVKRFNAQVAPRVAVSHDFGDWLSLHGSISSGFTNPASDQIQNPDRSINKNIQAEKGINYEIDAKGNLQNSRFNYDLALFLMNMRGELIGQSLPMGVTVYHNSGKTRHLGAELALSYQILKPSDDHFISYLRPYAGITYSHFRFTDYKELNDNNEVIADYSGNKLTGIAPWTVSLGVDIHSKPGIYLSGNLFYNGSYALNDANTDFNAAYTVVNTQLGYLLNFAKRFQLDIYAGIQNLTNEHYSSFTDINAPEMAGGAQYFNPSPGRNAYAGGSLKFFLKRYKSSKNEK